MLKKSNKHAYLSQVFDYTSMFVISEGKPASRDRWLPMVGVAVVIRLLPRVTKNTVTAAFPVLQRTVDDTQGTSILTNNRNYRNSSIKWQNQHTDILDRFLKEVLYVQSKMIILKNKIVYRNTFALPLMSFFLWIECFKGGLEVSFQSTQSSLSLLKITALFSTVTIT